MGATDLEKKLDAISKRWSDQAAIAQELDKYYGGNEHSLRVWTAAILEHQGAVEENAQQIRDIYAEASEMSEPLSASQQALRAVSERFDKMRDSLESLGESVTDATLAAEESAARQRVIAGMYQGLIAQSTAARRSSWGAEQWGAEQDRLFDVLSNIDTSSETYHDQSVSIMEQIWEANQRANELQAQTADNTSAIAAATQRLVSYDEARMGIDTLIDRLAGGDLAAAQSREFFESQYAGKLGAISGAGTPEEATRAVAEFSSFLPEFLSFMNAYGLDYATLTAQAAKDLSGAKAKLPADYYEDIETAGLKLDTEKLEEILKKGLFINFEASGDITENAAMLLSFLDMTFNESGQITEQSKTFTVNMAAELADTGDTKSAMQILNTLWGNEKTRTLTIPFMTEFARTAQPPDVQEMLKYIIDNEAMEELIVPFAVRMAEANSMSAQDFESYLTGLGVPEDKIIKVIMSLDWGVTEQEFIDTMKAYQDAAKEIGRASCRERV
jgi:hypothetical protein